MSKKALLILIGGRQIPNLLSAMYLKPDIIVPIASHETLQEKGVWSNIGEVLQQICPEGLQDPKPVNAFDLKETLEACQQAIQEYPDAEWVFNVTCATTIMSIGAYEIAKAHNKTAWYLDTNTRNVVTLSGNHPRDDMYKLSVLDYMQVYGRYPQLPEPQTPKSKLVECAKSFAQHPMATMKLRDRLRKTPANKKKETSARTMELDNLSPDMQKILVDACYAGLINSCTINAKKIICELPSGQELWEFINGLWLEIYAWASGKEAACFDDCCYGLKIPNEPNQSDKQDPYIASNELDLAATYGASLLIAECKTEEKSFSTDHLGKLRSIAGMIGGNFVGCVFITSQFKPKQQEHFEAFEKQAKERQVVVVTGEELGNLSSILAREAKKPTYFRG